VTTSPATPALPTELVALWGALGPRARQVLLALARRLALGAQRYQDDLSPGRDWRQEAQEEVLDACVYASRALLVDGDQAQRGAHPAVSPRRETTRPGRLR
jgi:hypothetical protein